MSSRVFKIAQAVAQPAVTDSLSIAYILSTTVVIVAFRHSLNERQNEINIAKCDIGLLKSRDLQSDDAKKDWAKYYYREIGKQYEWQRASFVKQVIFGPPAVPVVRNRLEEQHK